MALMMKYKKRLLFFVFIFKVITNLAKKWPKLNYFDAKRCDSITDKGIAEFLGIL